MRLIRASLSDEFSFLEKETVQKPVRSCRSKKKKNLLLSHLPNPGTTRREFDCFSQKCAAWRKTIVLDVFTITGENCFFWYAFIFLVNVSCDKYSPNPHGPLKGERIEYKSNIHPSRRATLLFCRSRTVNLRNRSTLGIWRYFTLLYTFSGTSYISPIPRGPTSTTALNNGVPSKFLRTRGRVEKSMARKAGEHRCKAHLCCRPTRKTVKNAVMTHCPRIARDNYTPLRPTRYSLFFRSCLRTEARCGRSRRAYAFDNLL